MTGNHKKTTELIRPEPGKYGEDHIETVAQRITNDRVASEIAQAIRKKDLGTARQVIAKEVGDAFSAMEHSWGLKKHGAIVENCKRRVFEIIKAKISEI